MKKLISAFLSLCMVFSLGAVALATDPTPTVTFDASAKAFSFADVTMHTGSDDTQVPDLFPNLKGVMPGDTITQEIAVNTQNIGRYDTVKLYLQAVSEEKDDASSDVTDYDTLMDAKATLTVKQGETDITASLGEPLLLGSFKEDSTTALTVTIELPITAGNEIAALAAQIDWVFTAEIITNKPAPTPDPTWPVTPKEPTTPTPEEPTILDTIVDALEDLVNPDEPDRETIDDADIPTAGSDVDDVVTGELEDDEIPLIATTSNAAWAFANLLLLLLTAATCIVLLFACLLAKRAQDDDEDSYITMRSRLIHGLLSLLVTLVSFIWFIVTEDTSLPMAFVDKWTLAMLLIALVQVGVVISSRRKTDAEEETT